MVGPWAGPLVARLGYALPLTPMTIPVYYWQADHFLPHTFSYEGEYLLRMRMTAMMTMIWMMIAMMIVMIMMTTAMTIVMMKMMIEMMLVISDCDDL